MDQPELQQRQVRNQNPDRQVDKHRRRVLETQHPRRHCDPQTEDARDPLFPFPESN